MPAHSLPLIYSFSKANVYCVLNTRCDLNGVEQKKVLIFGKGTTNKLINTLLIMLTMKNKTKCYHERGTLWGGVI